MASLDPDTLEDLRLQLDNELGTIIKQYSSYVNCIRRALQEKGVTARDLCSDLMSLSAFNHTALKRMLLSSHQTELERAADLNAIFNLLLKEYASFLNYEIFQLMVDQYKIDDDREELKYPDHLEAYINRRLILTDIKYQSLSRSIVC